MTRAILHLDMDAFYAAIEQRDDPQLRGRPVLIGGHSARSVVCTASYEARPSGARSAMPMGEARRRCPSAIVIPPRIAHYARVSRDVMAIFRRYTPLVEPLSLDEAFLDVTASEALFGPGPSVAERIRDEVRRELELTVSAGVATNKFVAKVASDWRKPDAMTVVAPGDEARFLAPLPIERMWGIGPKAAAVARTAQIHTIGEMARSTRARLVQLFGEAGGVRMHALARGEDDREVEPVREAQSIGAEETFDRDLAAPEELEAALLAQAERVARRLTAAGLGARTVTLKVKLADFRLLSRRRTVPEPITDTVSIHRVLCELLAELDLGGRPVRLTGVSTAGLTQRSEDAPQLFPDVSRARRDRLEAARLAIDTRYGDGTMRHAGARRERP